MHRSLNEHEATRQRFEEAGAIYQAIGNQLGAANVLFGLADLDRIEKRWSEAEAKYWQALAYYQATGLVFNVALAYQRLGHTAKGAGDTAAARRYYQSALELFTQIGSPAAKKVQADLDALS